MEPSGVAMQSKLIERICNCTFPSNLEKISSRKPGIRYNYLFLLSAIWIAWNRFVWLRLKNLTWPKLKEKALKNVELGQVEN